MSDNRKVSLQNSQPKKKKRRVKSNLDNNGQSDTKVKGGVSTSQEQTSPSLSTLVRIHSDPYYSGTSPIMSNLQTPQSMQMQGTMQSPKTYSFSPPSLSMMTQPGLPTHMPMNYKPEWANELIENVKLVKQV